MAIRDTLVALAAQRFVTIAEIPPIKAKDLVNVDSMASEALGSLCDKEVGRQGIYLFETIETEIAYPLGHSKIYYIGKGEELCNRMGGKIQADIADTERNHRFPGPIIRFNYTYLNYIQTLGVRIKVLGMDLFDQDALKDIESVFLLAFLEKYGNYPAANKNGPLYKVATEIQASLTSLGGLKRVSELFND